MGAGASRRTRASARSRSSRRWSARARSATGWMRRRSTCASRPTCTAPPPTPSSSSPSAPRGRARRCGAVRWASRSSTATKAGGGGTTLRTLRNMRSEGVLTYHFVEPIERHRVIVRTPRFRPALLVPFRLPNIATREVVRRFGHALRRNLLDRNLGPDIDQVLGADADAPPAAAEQRVYAHIAAHLAYYSATIIAAGDPAERFFAL